MTNIKLIPLLPPWWDNVASSWQLKTVDMCAFVCVLLHIQYLCACMYPGKKIPTTGMSNYKKNKTTTMTMMVSSTYMYLPATSGALFLKANGKSQWSATKHSNILLFVCLLVTDKQCISPSLLPSDVVNLPICDLKPNQLSDCYYYKKKYPYHHLTEGKSQVEKPLFASSSSI